MHGTEFDDVIVKVFAFAYSLNAINTKMNTRKHPTHSEIRALRDSGLSGTALLFIDDGGRCSSNAEFECGIDDQL